ncbi:MAG: uracil-DNA glycosylase [Sulfitobacter sp.]
MESSEFHASLALLNWQVELGVTDAICDAPVNRYDIPATVAKPAPPAAKKSTGPKAKPDIDVVAEAKRMADAANDLEGLRAAIAAYPHCDLKQGARNLVFSDGVPSARVMIIGEAPGRDEDREGRPFVGTAGQLLDRMLSAIHMGRDHKDAPVYITNVLPWRPPQNREPKPEEIAMMLPFLSRHIALIKPEVLVLMGNVSCQAMLGKRGITRLRGQWTQSQGLAVLPMFHPAYLLRTAGAKREAWADLLSLRARLRDG